MGKLDVVVVNADCVDERGYFCRMSKMKSDGNQRKLTWCKERFKEGMEMTLLGDGERGFVEVLPGARCFRPIKAAGWDVIHCLWVVGKSKGKGFGGALLALAVENAKKKKRDGVAVVTREKNWITPQSFFAHHGFEVVDEGADGFVLMAKALKKAAQPPRFTTRNWEARLKKHDKGLVVFRTNQCPYLGDAIDTVIALGKELKVPVEVVELTSAAQVRSQAPSPYGVYAVGYEGKMVSYCYELPKDLKRKVLAIRAAA